MGPLFWGGGLFRTTLEAYGSPQARVESELQLRALGHSSGQHQILDPTE